MRDFGISTTRKNACGGDENTDGFGIKRTRVDLREVDQQSQIAKEFRVSVGNTRNDRQDGKEPESNRNRFPENSLKSLDEKIPKRLSYPSEPLFGEAMQCRIASAGP
jgi:hypothetical protein